MVIIKKTKQNSKVLKLMQFPCFDALSYMHFCEGKIDVVLQCQNKIWDVHAIIPIISAAGGVGQLGIIEMQNMLEMFYFLQTEISTKKC